MSQVNSWLFYWARETHLICTRSLFSLGDLAIIHIGATFSLQEPFHCRHPFIPHFHSMAKAMRRKTNTKGLDKKAMGKAPATNCQAMEARMVVMIAPRNPKLKNSCIPSETPKSTRLGRTMLSIQQLFHVNTKISTISSQDGWLLFDELDRIRFDAKTRGPSAVRQGQEPRFTSRIKFASWCRKRGVSVRPFMQFEIDSVLPALRALFGLI